MDEMHATSDALSRALAELDRTHDAQRKAYTAMLYAGVAFQESTEMNRVDAIIHDEAVGRFEFARAEHRVVSHRLDRYRRQDDE